MEKPVFRDLRDPEVWDSGEWNEWDWAAHVHKEFKRAFETLVAEGCDGSELFDILERIRDLDTNNWETGASPDDIRGIREGLEQGRLALRGLVEGLTVADLIGPDEGPAKVIREEWRLLHYSRDDADAALRILRDLSDQLKKLQRGADRRRRRVLDQYRAILVRYVKRTTGKPHDRLVCDLLEVALTEWPDMYGIEEAGPEADPDHPWEEITVEAHRRWRGRNKKLIDDPPQLEEQWLQDLKRKAAERTEPKPQRFWSNISSHGGVKRKNR